jgi:LAGLIDADG endonuclease
MKLNKKKANSFFHLKPGEGVSDIFLLALKKANLNYSKTKNFLNYMRDVETLFQLTPIIKKTVDCHFYLAGFLEGEGSLNIGAKKNNTSRFKVYLDPEFNITQHINGISNLYLAMSIFQTGRIRFKSGSLATFVYTIDNRLNLEEKVIPFYEKYVNRYGCQIKQYRVALFKKVLTLFKEKAHLNLDRMINEILPLWYELRMQIGQSNQTFTNLKDAQTYVKNAVKKEK